MSKDRNGNILVESLISLLCLLAMCVCVSALCRLQAASSQLDDMEDTFMVKSQWEAKGRCRIYCPKDDPIVDITY